MCLCVECNSSCRVFRVGQNCTFTPYMTVYLVISLPKIPYKHRIYMVLANPTSFAQDGVGIRLHEVGCGWRSGFFKFDIELV